MLLLYYVCYSNVTNDTFVSFACVTSVTPCLCCDLRKFTSVTLHLNTDWNIRDLDKTSCQRNLLFLFHTNDKKDLE